MTPIPQTSPRRLIPAWAGWLVAPAAVLAVLAFALAPHRDHFGHEAIDFAPHAFDVDLWRGLPLAIKLHILSAVGPLAVGAVLMFAKKGRLFHRLGGWLWVGLASLVVGSSIFIRELSHGSWSVLHLFTAWTLIVLPLAVLAARRHKVASHRRTMMGLFYGGFAINMLIAFIPGRTMWNLFF